jgi:hypothetical protein
LTRSEEVPERVVLSVYRRVRRVLEMGEARWGCGQLTFPDAQSLVGRALVSFSSGGANVIRARVGRKRRRTAEGGGGGAQRGGLNGAS